LGCCLTRRRAALAQSAERFTRNEQVVGSIPTGGSRSEAGIRKIRTFRGDNRGD
jgi:hypothetical protein